MIYRQLGRSGIRVSAISLGCEGFAGKSRREAARLLAEKGLDAINCADWLKALILDGIIAGVGAVLGFVPQMAILFL